ncbi:MAG: hypothetical protein DDT19_00062 [Syntrophomonadaceae bacterium]|nr:hypothetical protein [Bacillota bacterium]
MKENLGPVFDRYIDWALEDQAQGIPNCLSCFNFVISGEKISCELKKSSGRDLESLLERREYLYYRRKAKRCGRWEGDE